MPKFQQWSDTGGQKVLFQPAQAPKQIVNTNAAKSLAGAAQFAQAIVKQIDISKQQDAKDYATKTQAQLSVDWAKQDAALRQSAKTGEEYLQGVSDFFTKQRQAITEAAPNTYAAKQVNTLFEQMQASALSSSVYHAASITADNAVATNQQAFNNSKTAVYLNPNSYDDQVKNLKAQIDNAPIPEAGKEKLLNDQLQDLRRSQVQGMIRNDPYQAVTFLQKDVGLSAQDHQVLMRQAVAAKEASERTLIAQQVKTQKLADEMQKNVYSKTSKDGDELYANHQLTPQWVSQNRSNMSDADYRYFTKLAAGVDRPQQSDISAYVELDSRARAGGDVSTDARHALINGQITQSDYDKIMNRAEQHDQLPTPYKQGEKYLSTVFQVSPLNPAIGASERRANALNEFDDWYRNTPNATVSQSMDKAREIERRYQLADLDEKTQKVLYGPAPLYLQGTRQKPDINATIVKTAEAYQKGELTSEQFQREQQLIVEWNGIIKQTEQTNQTTGGK